MAEIVTLTPNPAIDLATSVDRIVPSRKLRCIEPRRDPGGGGVNVARVVKRFGGDVLAIVPVGGFTGQLLQRLIDEEGIPNRTIVAAAETREDFSVTERQSGQQYRFVVPGLPLREAEWRACLETLAACTPPPKFVVGSGSLPPEVPVDFYARAAAIARKLGAKFALDTSGAPLNAAIDHGVDLIKPNLREMRDLAGVELLDQDDWVNAARELIARGKVEVVALSLGHLGALLVTREQAIRARPLPITPLSSVGAGDSFLGGMVYSLTQGNDFVEAFRLGVAAASSALINVGTELCRPDDAYRLYADVSLASV